MSDQPPPIPGTYAQDPYLPPIIPGPLHGGLAPHRGGLILGLGVGSLVVFFSGGTGFLFPPCCLGTTAISIGLAVPAWVMANHDIAAMKAGRMDPSGRGQTDAGRVCAIISVILNGLSLLGCLGTVAFTGMRGLRSGRPPWRP